MAPPIRIDSLTFTSGTEIPIESDITVLVGPNNSGKTRALVEILNILATADSRQIDQQERFSLSSLSATNQLGEPQMREWFSSHRLSSLTDNPEVVQYHTVGVGSYNSHRLSQDMSRLPSLGELHQHMARFIAPGDGRQFIGRQSRLGRNELPQHAIHVLQTDPEVRRQFAQAIRAAFGQNLIINNWQSHIDVLLSPTKHQEDFKFESVDGTPSEELLGEFDQLQSLQDQSDGVRAFAGLLLTVMSGGHPILLLDEPETFLHPPQARQLGRYLAEAQREGQLFISTHSLDVVLGLLDQNQSTVAVLRLLRQGADTYATRITTEMIQELWKDPLLRHSRVLDGLFHEGVVLCEGESDTQFYGAVARHIGEMPSEGSAQQGAAINPADVLFTQVGGKDRMRLAAAALTEVNVPACVIVDFDALSLATTIEGILEALGGEFTDDMRRQLAAVSAAIRGTEKQKTVKSVLKAVQQVLPKADQDVELTAGQRSAVRDSVKPAGGWSAATKIGVASIPAGDATRDVRELLVSLRDEGIFVVPSGAVESWVKDAGGRSAQWVVAVVEKGLISTATEAQAFLRSVLQYLGTAAPARELDVLESNAGHVADIGQLKPSGIDESPTAPAES